MVLSRRTSPTRRTAANQPNQSEHHGEQGAYNQGVAHSQQQLEEARSSGRRRAGSSRRRTPTSGTTASVAASPSLGVVLPSGATLVQTTANNTCLSAGSSSSKSSDGILYALTPAQSHAGGISVSTAFVESPANSIANSRSASSTSLHSPLETRRNSENDDVVDIGDGVPTPVGGFRASHGTSMSNSASRDTSRARRSSKPESVKNSSVDRSSAMEVYMGNDVKKDLFFPADLDGTRTYYEKADPRLGMDPLTKTSLDGGKPEKDDDETTCSVEMSDSSEGGPAGQHIDRQPDFPEGGLEAWLVILGGVLIFFCSFGWCNAFGVFQTYYITTGFLEESRSAVSWIGSLQMWGAFFGAGLAGSLFDRFGAKNVIVPGSLTFVFGIMMQSLCTKYYQLIIAQGILQGLSIGMLFTPSVAACNHWFLKKRGMAIGIVVSGASLGGVFWPILLNQLLNKTTIGYAWSLRICGFIALALLVPGFILVKGRLPRKTNFHPWAFRAFIQKVSGVYLLSCFFIFWGTFIPYTYLGLKAKKHGISTEMSFYITSVLNAGSFVGRIIPGIISDYYGKFNMFIACSLAMGILSFLWLTTTNVWQDMLFAAAFGAASGACVSVSGACAAYMAPRPSEIGTYMGTMFLVISVSSLTGSPIAGQIVSSENGNYTGAIVFAGCVIMVGCGLLCLCRYLQQPKLIAKF